MGSAVLKTEMLITFAKNISCMQCVLHVLCDIPSLGSGNAEIAPRNKAIMIKGLIALAVFTQEV